MNKQEQAAVLTIVKHYLSGQVDAQALENAKAVLLGQATEETATPTE